MAYTTPRTWVTGEVSTAAYFNSDVRDNIKLILYKPAVRVKSSSMTFSNVGADISFDSIRWDSDGMAPASLPFTTLTIQTTGLYWFWVGVEWNGTNNTNTGRRILDLRINGAIQARTEDSPANTIVAQRLGSLVLCTAGDTFTWRGAQTVSASAYALVSSSSSLEASANWISG